MQKTIEKILDQTTPQARKDGLIWYTKLNRHCRDLGKIYNQPTWKVTAIMSALSPRTSFSNNIHDLEQLLKFGKNAKLKSPLFKKKALAILDTKCYNEVRQMFSEKTGRKTLSFWENLMLIGNRVTLDVWMLRGLGLEGSLTNKKYREAEKAIQDYAEKVGLRTYDLQAILWCTVRKESF